MKIGMLTDSLDGLDFDTMHDAAAELGVECLEFGCGNRSSAAPAGTCSNNNQ